MFGRLGRWLVERISPNKPGPDLEKRATARAADVPVAWRTIIERELPHYRRLSETQRAKLLGDVNVFIAEKVFFGDAGFVVDDRAKVLVAASAALIAIGRDIAIFDHVTRVVIRPDIEIEAGQPVGGHYIAKTQLAGDEIDDHWGEVEIAWTQLEAAFGQLEGQNTAVHELAHAFDHSDGRLDALQAHPHYDRWRARLRDLTLSERVVGNYEMVERIGDVDGPELFASATELFFECPRRLHRLDPSLFEALSEIYAIDPRTLVDR
jgi:MtfA peptidase